LDHFFSELFNMSQVRFQRNMVPKEQLQQQLASAALAGGDWSKQPQFQFLKAFFRKGIYFALRPVAVFLRFIYR
jgi:hypothetical protein